MADALFESNWQPTKDALCEGLEGNRKAVMETVLENPKDIQVRGHMQIASTFAGLAISLTKTAIAHSISYQSDISFNSSRAFQTLMHSSHLPVAGLRARYAGCLRHPSARILSSMIFR